MRTKIAILGLVCASGCANVGEATFAYVTIDNASRQACLRYDEAVPPGESDELVVTAGRFELEFDVGIAGDDACDFSSRATLACAIELAPDERTSAVLTDGVDGPVLDCP